MTTTGPRVARVALAAALAAAALARVRADEGPELLDTVPDVVQSTDYSCGCAALEAVLAYWGIGLTEKEIIEEAKVDPETGAEMEHLLEVAKKRGLKGVVRERLVLRDLAKELQKGRPVIALIQAWRADESVAWKDDWDDGHYVVVIGIDRKNVYVEDPSLEDARGEIPHAEFIERWHCWTIDGRKTHGQAILIGGREVAKRAKGPRKIERVK